MNTNNKIKGIVITAASTLKKLRTSSLVLLESIINPEIMRPNDKERRLATTQAKVINGTISLQNQLKINFIAVFKINILPVAAVRDPSRHIYGFPSAKNVLNQAPPVTSPPPIKQLILIPQRLMIQLQGQAKIAWTIGNNNVFRVTSTADIPKSVSTVEFIPEKVLLGSEFTSAAAKYTAITTKRYLVSFGICGYCIVTIIES